MPRFAARELKLRLYPGEHDDLIRWCRENENQHGRLSLALITALRAGIQVLCTPATAQPDDAQVEILAQLQAVLDKLDHLQVAGPATPTHDPEVVEAAANLDGLLERLAV